MAKKGEHLKKYQWTSERQPSFEARSRGQSARQMLQKLLEVELSEGEIKDKIIAFCEAKGIPQPERFNTMLQANLKMLELAMNGDVNAYRVLMETSYGKPRQEIEVEAKELPPILDTNALLDEKD